MFCPVKSTRIIGRSDAMLSTMVIGSGDAHNMIPKDAQGMFLVNGSDTDELAMFRGFWFNPNLIPRESWEIIEAKEVNSAYTSKG